MEILGELTPDRDVEELSGEDLEKGELGFGLPAALVVFLLSRIRERFDRSRDTREATAFGVGSTARHRRGRPRPPRRSDLVPPRWLDWLPHLTFEGSAASQRG
jgi:hypothetical protein